MLELALGYNGLGRLTGQETGSVGGGRWGETGLLRLFDDSYGGQASWLMPLAVTVLAAGLWATRRRPRTDLLRAGFVLWGGWLVVTGVVFSFMAGIIHEYYTVALAPAIGSLVGGGGMLLWRLRRLPWVVATSVGAVVVTGWWSFVLLGRADSFVPWLRWAVLVGSLAVAAGMLATQVIPRLGTRLGRRFRWRSGRFRRRSGRCAGRFRRAGRSGRQRRTGQLQGRARSGVRVPRSNAWWHGRHGRFAQRQRAQRGTAEPVDTEC